MAGAGNLTLGGGPSSIMSDPGYSVTTADMALAAAAEDGGGASDGDDDTLDGDVCDGVYVTGPLASPQPNSPAANYSLIGARPYDLGAMIRGSGPYTPGF